MAKKVQAGDAAIDQLMEGISLAARTAAITIGPMGRYVLADRAYGVPIMRDAVSAIRPLGPAPQVKGMGIAFARDVAVRTSDAAGDGTATASILFNALMREGRRYLASGTDAGHFARRLNTIAAEVVAEITQQAVMLETPEQFVCLATSAANGDERIGRMAAQAVAAAGEGMVLAQVTAQAETTMDVTSGIRSELVAVCPELAPNQRQGSKAVHNPLFYLHQGSIENFDDLVPVLEAAAKGRTLVIIAENVLGSARAGLIMNRKENVADILAFKPANPRSDLADCLADLSAATGAMIHGNAHISMPDAQHPYGAPAGIELHSGRAEVLIRHTGAQPAALEPHRKALRAELANAKEGIKTLGQRLANLEGQSVVINVGGHTEIEARETRDRINTALRTVTMARQTGVVPGGSIALLRAIDAVSARFSQSDPLPLACMQKALAQPAMQIIANAGHDAAPIIARLRHADADTVFDVTAAQYRDCHSAGLQDPAGTVICALQHAVSLAALLLNSSVFLVSHTS